MLKQNALGSKNAKLKCCEISTLQTLQIKMQQKIIVLQYLFLRSFILSFVHSFIKRTETLASHRRQSSVVYRTLISDMLEN